MKYGYVLAALIAAGCASHEPVPVIERAAPAPETVVVAKPAVPVPVAAGEGAPLYTVKKGDTLYSIALEHGRDYKDVAAWNNLENVNRIQVGQQLRIAPPEGAAPVAVVKPVISSAPLEAKPVELATTPAPNTDAIKREPKGGKVAYSDQALAHLREAVPQQTEKPAEKPPEKPEEKPIVAAQPSGDDAIDWAWPAPGKTVATFAEGGAGVESSKGIDIAGKAGEPVMAAAAGKVVYVGNGLRGYGNLVIVRHNASYLSAYAHNSKILVKETQAVARGQKIAEIGNSDADQAELHFEIRRLGKPVDPLKYLPARP